MGDPSKTHNSGSNDVLGPAFPKLTVSKRGSTEVTHSQVEMLKFVFLALAIVLGFCRAWAGRFLMNPDGISYLDLGDAYLRADWRAAVNGVWSPLYSWLLGGGLKVLRPSAYWQFPAVHLINFVVYLGTLSCFHFFLAMLIRYHRSQRERYQKWGVVEIPESVWVALGYTLFIVSAMEWMPMAFVCPDMCEAAFVYLASGILLSLHTRASSWRSHLVLGTSLGFGYLAKAAMLPLSVIFVLASLSPREGVRKALYRASLVFAGLALITAPYIIVLSKRQGHLTYSETPKLAYAWLVNNVPQFHWTGETPGFGKPIHPSRKIFDHPAAFEFGSPVPGTYPPGYDPAYWYEGVVPRLVLWQEMRIVLGNIRELFRLFFSEIQTGGVAVGILALYLLSPSWRVGLRNVARQWFILLPPIAALALYSLVYVEGRYIGAYFTLFWLGMISGVGLPDLPQSRKFLTCITIAVVSVSLTEVIFSTAKDVRKGAKAAPVQWQVADYLQRIGIRSGDQVAALGDGTLCGWARLAQVRITAEIPPQSVPEYRAANDELKARALGAIFGTGVKAIVADHEEESGCETGWQSADRTGYYVCTAPGAPLHAKSGVAGIVSEPTQGN
jgi:hypothetical protein